MTVNIKRETKVELQFVVVCVIWGGTHAFVSVKFLHIIIAHIETH